MKKYCSFLIACSLAITAQTQSYQGFQTGNYTGVNGVFFNPANVADSRYSWDLNLVGVSLLAGNNNASMSFGSLTKNFDSDSLLNQFTSNGKNKGLIMADIHGPSLMFNIGKKSALAFTTRAVAMVNIHNLDGRLIQSIVDEGAPDTYPYNINMPGVSGITAHGYTEYGFTYGQVLLNNKKTFMKAGITAKYLSGAGNFYLQFNDVQATLNKDVAQDRTYLSNATGSLGFGFSGISFSDIKASDILKSKSTGWGADIGVVFELRDGSGNEHRDENKYKLKISAALQDFGSISYDKDPNRSAAYKMNIAGTQRFYTDNLGDVSVDSFKAVLDRFPQFFTKNGMSTGSYKARLPASVAVNVDYHLHKGFYINAGAQLPLSNADGYAWNTYKYFSATVTPRFEGRALGLFVPISYHQLSGFTAGAAIRMGFVYIGSGSILNAIAGKTKQVDVMFGLHIGRLFHNKQKSKEAKSTGE
jgi:hypothetical protein